MDGPPICAGSGPDDCGGGQDGITAAFLVEPSPVKSMCDDLHDATQIYIGYQWSYIVETQGLHMCGITGWVDFSRDMTQERALIDAMTQTMACRGPDASGVWSDHNAALGHRR